MMTPSIFPAMPHIFILVMSCVCLLVAAFSERKSPWVYYLVQFTLLVSVWLSYISFTPKAVYLFDRTFIADGLSCVLNMFIAVFTFVTFIYSRQYTSDRNIPTSEYYLLGLLATLGMMVLVSSCNLLTLYLGLEILALPTYAMVALQRDNGIAIEAAMKYFVIGAMATGMLLYGMSMVFGATQSLDLARIAEVVAQTPPGQNMLLVFALVFILAGIAFKLGSAPFHMWVPDVYEGAPTAVSLFVAGAPKIAAFALVVRLLPGAFASLHVEWQHILIVMAVLSLAIGNISALVQTNIKRLLAYSSIAHMGYFLLAVACDTPRGFGSAMFYMITYTLMTLVGFGMLILFSKAGYEVEQLDDLKGLNRRNPWMAFVMLMVMFSMAGIPPFVGFMAKIGVLEALIGAGWTVLAVVAILFAIIGAYYYIRVVKVMYFEEPDQPQAFTPPLDGQIAITLNGLLVLALGLLPGGLFTLCHRLFA